MEVNENVVSAVDKYFGETAVPSTEQEMLPSTAEDWSGSTEHDWDAIGLFRPDNAEFLEGYHKEVLASGAQLDEEGAVTTLGLTILSVGEREHYLIPSYDPDNHVVRDSAVEEDRDYLLNRLQWWVNSGMVVPYSTVEQAEEDRATVLPIILERTDSGTKSSLGIGEVRAFKEGGYVAQSPESKIANILGISNDDLEWAKSLGGSYGDSEELDGRGDAARHLALGWLASRSKNPEIARKAINAREYLTFDNAGKEMDLSNNGTGFGIQAQDRQQAEERIQDLIKNKKAVFMAVDESKNVRGYQEGGLVEEPNEYDKILMANKDKNFIQRMTAPYAHPVVNNADGSLSTHRMATEVDDETGEWYVFPTVQEKKGKLVEYQDARKALAAAKETGDYINFGKDKEKALDFGENYKKAKVWKQGYGRSVPSRLDPGVYQDDSGNLFKVTADGSIDYVNLGKK